MVEIRSKLYSFTIEKKCEENIAFLERVDHFRVMKNSANRYLEATKILFTFIQKNSEFELNLPFNIKNKFNIAFTACSEEFIPITLFDDISELIFRELKQDNFKSFLQNEIWIRFIHKNQYLLKDILTDDDEIINTVEVKEDSAISKNDCQNEKLLIFFGFPTTQKASIIAEGISSNFYFNIFKISIFI